jgi:hypothetical protein
VVALFGLACLTPAIRVDDGRPSSDLDFRIGTAFGWEILLWGWGGGNNGIPWSANVFLGLGLLLLALRRFRAACVLGATAAVLGLTTWWVWGYESVRVGYFLWQSSLIALGAGAGWASFRSAARGPHLTEAIAPTTGRD